MSDAKVEVGVYVKWKIDRIGSYYDDSHAKASLAGLRRGIGKAPGSLPELWNELFDGMPEMLVGKGVSPSYGEQAVYTALTLYALHQQGKDRKTQRMNQDGCPLGRAVRKLSKSEEDLKRVKRRFDAAATSDSLPEFSHHLRGLVQLLRSESIPLDYPLLAKELYLYQFPQFRDAIRLQWGRDFHRVSQKNEAEDIVND